MIDCPFCNKTLQRSFGADYVDKNGKNVRSQSLFPLLICVGCPYNFSVADLDAQSTLTRREMGM